jgi:RNA polymerase sigma-70 factor (ECF subfamily)
LECSFAAQGTTLSKYHLEASFAYWGTVKADTAEKWESILQLYNQLLQLEYSPIAALDRTFALSKVKGAELAIIEAEKLKLENNHYYFTLLGALYKGLDDEKSRIKYEKAYLLAKTKEDKAVLERKLVNSSQT